MPRLLFSAVRGRIRLQAAAGFALLAFVIWTASVQAAPYRPDSDATVLEKLPAPGDATSRELRRLRKDLIEAPQKLALATALAGRYIGLGRDEADPRYYAYAEAALRPWWDLETPPIQVLVLRAVVYQSRHDFDLALSDLKRVLAQRPNHAQALLTQAFVLQVKGRHGAALRSCQGLPTGVDPLVGAICIGRIASLTGEAAQGYEMLRRAVAERPGADTGLRLWALTNLAEIAVRLGKTDEASRYFRDALGIGQRNTYLLGVYADFLLDLGRTEDAHRLLQDEIRADTLLLRLAIAENRLGHDAARVHSDILMARFDASRRRGSQVHRREEARFNLDILQRPGEALRLAEANWAVQKEPPDAALVLQAALATGQPERALPVAEWLRGVGLEDVAIDELIRRVERGRS